jgi:hypothetical protein
VNKEALLQNWMKNELNKFKENQEAPTLSPQKHPKDCIIVGKIGNKDIHAASEIAD